jgi:hypothetical protein
MTLTPIPRDVLQMLEAELRLARRGETRLVEIQGGGKPDADYVEMLEDTIAEIKRLKRAASAPDRQAPAAADSRADATRDPPASRG